ncbi:MAG: glutathione S-transferase family protein [Parvularculaceae bacterium]
MLRVLGRPTSINVRKVLVTLDEIGAPYTHEPQWATPDAPAKSPGYLKLNPNALVPVIVDGDFVMWDRTRSAAISRANTNATISSGCASAPRTRRHVARLAGDRSHRVTWGPAFLGLVRKEPPFAGDAARIAESARQWNAAMAILDARLAETGSFVAGDSFTLADIVVGLAAHRWRATPIDHRDLPAVAAWLKRLDARPAFARWTAPATP